MRLAQQHGSNPIESGGFLNRQLSLVIILWLSLNNSKLVVIDLPALKGNYYLIQFGHNNQPGKPRRSKDTVSYSWAFPAASAARRCRSAALANGK